MPIRPFFPFGGSGAGFTLGPIDNIFGTTSGNANTNPLLVVPAANRAAAEVVRDAYFTANPTNLATYDADGNEALGILVYYLDGSQNEIQPQTRVGGAWRDNAAIIAIQGLPGSGTDFSNVSDNHIPAIGVGPNKVPFDSGMQVLDTGQILAPRNFGIESGSIDFGDLVTLSEVSGFLGVFNRESSAQFALVDSRFTTAGSVRPRLFELGAQRTLSVQPIQSDTLTPLAYDFNYTTTVTAQTNSLTIKPASAITNFKARISDVTTGVVFKYWPDKATWLATDGGTDFPSGADALIDFEQSQIRFSTGREIRIEFTMSTGSLFGDQISGVPYSSALIQDAEFTEMPYRREIGNLPLTRIEMTGNLTITSANVATYENSLIVKPNASSSTNWDLIVEQDCGLKEFSFFNDSVGRIRLAGTGTLRFNSEIDLSITQFEGGRAFSMESNVNRFGIIYANDDPDMTDNYVDAITSLVAGNDVTITLGRNGGLSDLPTTFTLPASGGGGEQLESLFNAGTPLLRGTPVVSFAHTDGTLRMTRANTTNVGHNTGPGQVENYIYGFLTEEVATNASSIPIRSGIIVDFQFQASNNDVNRRVKLTLNGQNYQLSDDTTRDPVNDYASFAGYVKDPNLGDNRDDIIISLDWIEQSRESRLTETVSGKEGVLGDPTTDGQILSSTIAGVRTWVDNNGGGGSLSAVGTPTNDQYAQWASASTIRGIDGIPSADVVLDNVLLVSDGLISVPNETAYDVYVNRRVQFRRVNPGSGQMRIFQLPQSIVRDSGFEFVRTGDFFSVWNDPQDARGQLLRVRTFSSAESLSGTNTFIDLAVNEFVTYEVPTTGLSRWPLVDRGFVSATEGVSGDTGTSMDIAQVVSSSPFHRIQAWNLDADGEAYRSGDTSINTSDMLMNDNIRLHITNAYSNSNNPVELIFNDDQSRVNFWFDMTGDAALNLGDSVTSIRSGLDAAVTHLETLVGVGFDFVTQDPNIDYSIQAITPTGGQGFSLEIQGAPDLTTIPQLAVNRQIVIEGATNAVYNGEHTILAVTSQHLELSTAGTLPTESGSDARIKLNWYGRVVVATHATRQYNFNLFHDGLRVNQATFTTNTWNPAYDPDLPANTEASALQIAYISANVRPSLLTVNGSIAITDQEGTTHITQHGSYQEIFAYDNTGGNYQNTIDLPGNYQNLYVDTDGIILNGRINATTDRMVDGEARSITVFTADRSQRHHYSFNFYNPQTGVSESIEGSQYAFFNVNRNSHVTFFLYRNSETDRGIRIFTPIDRVRPFNAQLTTPTTATLANTSPLPMFSAALINDQDEDAGVTFGLLDQYVGVPDNSYQMIKAAEFTFEYNVDVLFNGAEGTGLLFVPVQLTPYINGAAQVAARSSTTLLFSRNGQTGAGAPKFQESLFSTLHWQATANDVVDFRLTFGTFPAGYSISDIQIQNVTPRITIKLGQG